MSEDKPTPKKRGRPKKKPPLAEVFPIREPDELMISILQDMLELAEAGSLTSLVACVTVDHNDEMILMGNPEQPAKTIGNLELIKAELIDCLRSFDAEEG